MDKFFFDKKVKSKVRSRFWGTLKLTPQVSEKVKKGFLDGKGRKKPEKCNWSPFFLGQDQSPKKPNVGLLGNEIFLEPKEKPGWGFFSILGLGRKFLPWNLTIGWGPLVFFFFNGPHHFPIKKRPNF